MASRCQPAAGEASEPGEPWSEALASARVERARGWPIDLLATVMIAAAVALVFGHAFLNYDTFYALVWGSDLVAGRRPQYGVPYAPTPHPLAIAAGALLSPLGDAAEEALLAAGLLGLGALAVGLFRLGQAVYAWPVGALAALIVLTRVPYLSYGLRGYVDLPAAALVVWAAVLEARRPRRGAAVLVLLALAGLLRPEVWLASAGYWLWLLPGRGWTERLGLALLAACAPVLWLLGDGLVTGDPLWSLTGTSRLAERLERPTGLTALPAVVPFRLGEILRLPELVAGVIGFAGALALCRRRGTLLLVVVAGLNGVAIVAFAVAGLPLLGRYMFVAAAMIAVWSALAALGWTALPAGHPARGRARALGTLILVVLAVLSPFQLVRLDELRADIARRDMVAADLRELVTSPRAGAAIERAGAVYLPTHRATPGVAYWSGLRAAQVRSAAEQPATGRGLFLAPASSEAMRLALLDPRDRTPAAPVPGGYSCPVARNRSWVVLEPCGATDGADVRPTDRGESPPG